MIVAYVRQSTKKQQSIPTQKELICKCAEKHHIDVDKIHFYSDIGSGRNTNRTDYQRLIQEIKNNQVTTLLIYRISRIDRNLKNALGFVELLQKYQVKLISVSDGFFDLSLAFDRMKLQLLLSFAENEVENIRDNVAKATHEKVKQGMLITTNAPFGYRYKNGNLFVHPEESNTVKKIFQLYCDQYGYKAISKFISEDKRYVSLTSIRVRNILMNKIYTGIVPSKYGEYQGHHQAIITHEAFEEAKRIRFSKQTQRKPMNTLLKRKIHCPYCNAKLHSHKVKKNNKTYTMYICRNHAIDYSGLNNRCPFTSINADHIENQVIDAIKSFLKDKECAKRIEQAVNKVIRIHQKNQRKIRQINTKLINDLAEGKISAQEFQLNYVSHDGAVQASKNFSIQKMNNIVSTHVSFLKLTDINHVIEKVIIDDKNELIGLYITDYPLNLIPAKKVKNQFYQAIG
ncbi:recombinase family protein [Macrococcus capreoli]|uniref:recombinase family protein n=1 Tax=Macrococcus capreoli TaxID=2982690 RepID=UPI0021D5FD6F|nr:recombinase family protein [Macrococcus sp. TMW 2.2395]MCU7557962.1 recombinase family protein [Macrococcus sp. TMW 2.2395]